MELIQSLPAAADISHLDLSHNQLLSWQCCGALGQLISVAAALAAATAAASATLVRQSGDHADAHKQQQAVAQLTGSSSEGADESAESTKGAVAPAAAAPARRPVAWGGAQPSFKRMVQPLQLQVLLLQGIVIQDRGAVLLAEALAGTQRLQVRKQVLRDMCISNLHNNQNDTAAQHSMQFHAWKVPCFCAASRWTTTYPLANLADTC